MLARSGVLSLALALFSNHVAALDLDVGNTGSIKSAAKTLASGIVASYNKSLEQHLTPGLFDDDTYYWWESANVFTELIEYSYLTGDSQYNNLISEALQHQLGEFNAFMPPNQTKSLGNDDQSFWGLASLTAHEAGLPKPADGEWLDFASNVWNTQVQRWDAETCDGGLRWQIFTFNNGYNYRNSISNGNFFLLSSRLAFLTGNTTYYDWASKSYAWSKEVGLISDDYFVFDGTDDLQNCTSVNRIQWSNNHAIYTEGSALMYNLTHGSQAWANVARGYMNSSSVFTKDKAISEVACEGKGLCDIDQRAFKSGAIRSFARAALFAPFLSESVQSLLEASAKGAANNCEGSGEDVACRLSWGDSKDSKSELASASNGNLGEVANALSAVKALLWSDAKPIATANGTGSSGPSSTGNGSPSGTSGATIPETTTSSAGTIATSFASILAVAFAAALSL